MSSASRHRLRSRRGSLRKRCANLKKFWPQINPDETRIRSVARRTRRMRREKSFADFETFARQFFMKLNEMRELLAKRGIQLTKSLGQNFLHDAKQLERIVASAELTKADKVLEIGRGLGPLTELLLVKAGEVLAVEMDGRLVEFLAERFGLVSKEGEPDVVNPTSTSPVQPENKEPPQPPSGHLLPRGGEGRDEGARLTEMTGSLKENSSSHPDNFFLLHDDALAYLKREP